MLTQTILAIGLASIVVVSGVLAKFFRVKVISVVWLCLSIFSLMMLIQGYNNRGQIVASSNKNYWSNDYSDFNSWVMDTWGQFASVDPRIADKNSDFWSWMAPAYMGLCGFYVLTFIPYAMGSDKRLIGVSILAQLVIAIIYFWPIANQIGFTATAVMWLVIPVVALVSMEFVKDPFGLSSKSQKKTEMRTPRR